MLYTFESIVYEGSGGGAYVIFPYDIREEFNSGRVKVLVTFDGIEYRGSIVNMGLKYEDGSICYVIGILKSIRQTLNKNIGDTVIVTVESLKTRV